jgi:hypothetical protein
MAADFREKGIERWRTRLQSDASLLSRWRWFGGRFCKVTHKKEPVAAKVIDLKRLIEVGGVSFALAPLLSNGSGTR